MALDMPMEGDSVGGLLDTVSLGDLPDLDVFQVGKLSIANGV